MYIGNDEFYEVEDYDEDIRLREQLLEEAKNIPSSTDWNEVNKAVNEVRKKWKRIPYRDTSYENELMEQFDECLNAHYAIRNEGYKGNKELKMALIEKAEKAAKQEHLNKATKEMEELMEEWKSIGSAGKNTDDALWEQFRAIRHAFFDRKKQYWNDRKEQFAKAKEIKLDLIEQVKAIENSEEWQKTSEQMKQLLDRWKAAGSAGKEHEDNLWEQFNSHRQIFFDRRNAYYEEQHEEQDKNYEGKRALKEEAQDIVAEAVFTREHTQRMKQLGVEWKAIGYCGKNREETIWSEFRSVMDAYFDGLKQYNAERQASWRSRMMEVRNRKMDLIQKQKNQIKRMEQEIVGLLGQRAIDEMELDIQDKEAFIAQLEEELEDIEKRLADDEKKAK